MNNHHSTLGGKIMGREIDRRDFSINRVTPTRENELRSLTSSVSDRLPGAHRVRIESFDATTGNPKVVISEAAPAAETANYIQRALDHVRNISSVLGLAPSQPAEFVADPHIQRTSSNAVTVHLHQHYEGIPIFQAAQAVRFAPDGTLKDTTGSSVTVAQEVPVSPRLTVQEAVLQAAKHVAFPWPDEQGATDQFGEPLEPPSVDLTNFVPRVTGAFPDKPGSPTVLDAGPFGDAIKASSIWFPLGNSLRLAWEVILTMPSYKGQYRTIVDTDTGEILYCRQLVQTVAARGNVHLVDGNSERQMTDFPRPLQDYRLPIPRDDFPRSFPDTWVAVDSTVGNSTNAHQGDDGPAYQGRVEAGVVTFDPVTEVDQRVLDLFQYCCYMHDYFYLLGFREADGNFQRDNLGRGGFEGDRVDARVFPEPVFGTASMATPIDSFNPIMRVGLVMSTNRHAALDSGVIYHEFTHGVTNRLVGGPLDVRALEAPQSAGMGEGWGDFIACTINRTPVIGAWLMDNADGLRGFPYDSNFPDNFGDLGTGRYREVHNIGEIWCATLMQMTRNIGNEQLGVQLVVDALKLSPSNPSFLDMRDSILRALDDKLFVGQLNFSDYFTALRGIWLAFAKFGMGPAAQSNGAQLSGIVADFRPPDRVR